MNHHWLLLLLRAIRLCAEQLAARDKQLDERVGLPPEPWAFVWDRGCVKGSSERGGASTWTRGELVAEVATSGLCQKVWPSQQSASNRQMTEVQAALFGECLCQRWLLCAQTPKTAVG